MPARHFRIETMMDTAIVTFGFRRVCLPSLVCLALVGTVGQTAAQTASGDTPAPGLFGPELQPLILAEQSAVSSGDPNAILEYSRELAVASLRLLAVVDPKNEDAAKALHDLPVSDRLVSDLPTELLLLRSELASDETADAIELEKHILSTNPESADLHITLSKTLEEGSDRDGGFREAARAVELEPNSPAAQIAMGMASWELNGFQYNEQTLQAFTAAQRLDADGYAGNFSLGLIESQYHRFDQAAIHLRAAVAANPSAPEPWYQLGMNAWDQDRPAEARDAIERYLSLAESSKRGKPGQVRLALLILDRIAEEEGSATDPAHRAEEQALAQQIAPQSDLAARTPDAGGGLMDTGVSGKTSWSGESATKADVKATPRQVRELAANSLNDMGTALARKHDYAAAVLPFHYAAEYDPTLDPVMRNLGFAAFLSGSYPESEKALRQELAIHPDDATARAYLGMSLFSIGKYSEAAETFQLFGSELSSKPLVEATAAAAFARSGQKTQAQAALADLEKASSDPQIQGREAVAWLDLGDVARATALAQAALSANAETADALFVLGEIALEDADGAGAVRAFQEELKVSSLGADDSLEARALLAKALIANGQRSQGETIAREIARTHAGLAASLRSEGETLLKNGDGHAAYEKLGAALVIDRGEEKLRGEFAEAKRMIQAR